MDSIDTHIIRLLQQNARQSVSEISSKVGLSVPAVSERIKKVEASGAIEQYTAIIAPAALGKGLTALMFVSLERPQFTEKFLSFVNLQEDILECHYIAGDFDYLLKIVTEGTATLEKLLTRIKSVPGIQKTRTMVVLCTVKNKHSVSPAENSESESGHYNDSRHPKRD
ncbi:MAG: Lrp/AsnC family transcriptional regulator [Clostridia bacterium]|nr:Lrp/AsnC family transcriptional regulator [Clostridia bacterium]MDR3644936.1 Lrp/AsnC family transcriptional regulator [Clostridia bacterium]